MVRARSLGRGGLPGDQALLLSELALSRGEAFEQLGRLDEARADYERALISVRASTRGRGWLEANILAAIVHLLWIQDRYEEGEAMIPEALAVAKGSGMPDVEARVLYTAGAIAWARADWMRAESLHEVSSGMRWGARTRQWRWRGR